jgi:hypothetical protein
MRLQAAVAIGALAAEGDLDRLPQQECPQLLLRRHLYGPQTRLGTDVDGPWCKRPDQAQLGAVIESHGLAIDYARHGPRRTRLEAGAREGVALG